MEKRLKVWTAGLVAYRRGDMAAAQNATAGVFVRGPRKQNQPGKE
jgi:hypothetical protein